MKMGNQQSEKKSQSGEDTPDEHKSGCCEIPKKKAKERNSKFSRTSRSEDNDIGSEDVNQFETPSSAKRNTSSPLDLEAFEAFEIIEADDICYVPGASSNDVIVSTSEGKFIISKESENVVKLREREDFGGRQKIALEDYFPRHSTEIKEELIVGSIGSELQTDVRKEISLENYFPRHSREIVDSADVDYDMKQSATWDVPASNLFANAQIQNEKRESKTQKSGKDKNKKDKRSKNVDVVVLDQSRYYLSPDQNQVETVIGTEHANVEILNTVDNKNIDVTVSEVNDQAALTTETDELTERKEIVCVSENTLNDMYSPTENNSTKDITTGAESANVESTNHSTVITPDGKVEEHLYDSIDPDYRLYDTINRQQSETSMNKKPTNDEEYKVYENIYSVKEGSLPQQEMVKPPTGFGDSTGDDSWTDTGSKGTIASPNIFDCEESLEDISLSREMIVKDIVDNGSNMSTEIVKTELNKEYNAGTNSLSGHVTTDCINNRGGEANNSQPVAPVVETTTKACDSRDEHVPPPTPSAMDILEEEEDEESTDVTNKSGKQIDEGVEQFGDIVCKRLSQLLEGQCIDTNSTEPDTNAVILDKDSGLHTNIDNSVIVDEGINKGFSAFIEHIDATSTGITKTKSEDKQLNIDSIPPKEINKNDVKQFESKSQNNTETLENLNADHNLSVKSRSNSAETLKRISGESMTYTTLERSESSDDDGLPDYFQPDEAKPKRDSEILCDVLDAYTDTSITQVFAEQVSDIVSQYNAGIAASLNLPLSQSNEQLLTNPQLSTHVDELQDITPTAEANTQLNALPELATADDGTPVQYENAGRRSIPCTESDLDISEQRDDMSTDSMLADDEAEETMEILFTKTYTEPVQGAEVFLSCTVVNSAYKKEQQEAEQWLSDEALEYLEANASDIMSTAFMKAKKEMKDIQTCLQSLRKQMEHFHTDVDNVRVPDTAVDSLSPDYMGLSRKAVTD